jgi:hypothetical protein
MTLKNNFDKNVRYDENGIESEVCVLIAEKFAIGFAEWLNGLDINDEVLQKHISTKELLEIYKKEKGL